jgi:phospholipid/cholesterol/gamma-HCH transport system substrate-binding protein
MKTEAKVGIFVLVSMGILLGSVYYVTQRQIRGAHVPYKTYLRYAGGLEAGADVLFGGIKVGNVTAVRWDPQDPTRIEIDMNVLEGTPLNANCIAKLGSVTIVTSPVISISAGSNDAARLPPGGVVPSQESLSIDDTERKIVAVADSARTLLDSVHKDVDELTGDAHQLIANLNDMSGKPNQQRVASILQNADEMISRISPKVDQIADQVQKLTTEADGAIAKVGPLLDNANATVSNANDTISSVREPLQTDLAEVRKTLEQTRSLLSDVQAAVRTKDQNVTSIIENLRMATDNLNDLTESIKERPWSLIRIKQAPDRKVPK